MNTYKLTKDQIKAIAALWDASDAFAEDTESEFADTVDQHWLIAARNMMGSAFPPEHPIYGNADYYDTMKAFGATRIQE